MNPDTGSYRSIEEIAGERLQGETVDEAARRTLGGDFVTVTGTADQVEQISRSIKRDRRARKRERQARSRQRRHGRR